MAKYTKAQENEMIEEYTANPTKETVEKIAANYHFPERSVIAKLSALGVYKKKHYTSKNGETPIKKSELADNLGSILNLQDYEVEQLEKISKPLIKKLISLFQNKD